MTNFHDEFLRPGLRFLGLPEEECAYGRAKYAILPVPYDSTTSYNGGTRLGPRAIIEASTQVELYDAQYGFDASARAAVHTLNELDPDLSSPERTVERCRAVARRLIDDGKFVITLGGEHTVSLGAIRALHDTGRFGKFTVLQIDAHADLRDEYEGTPYSHACVMRRVHDLGLPSLAVGVRAVSEEEHAFVRREGIRQEFYGWNLRGGLDPAAVLPHLSERVYVTVDVDGFDPAVFPGTGTPEPGGIGWHDFLDLFRAVVKSREVIGFDVVEVAPTPPYRACEFAAARLVYKMITMLEEGAAR